jgi:hypothetical protein
MMRLSSSGLPIFAMRWNGSVMSKEATPAPTLLRCGDNPERSE